jgi:hypothetical protein
LFSKTKQHISVFARSWCKKELTFSLINQWQNLKEWWRKVI